MANGNTNEATNNEERARTRRRENSAEERVRTGRGGPRDNSGGARENSGGARPNSGGARENSGGVRTNSGGARVNSGGRRERSGRRASQAVVNTDADRGALEEEGLHVNRGPVVAQIEAENVSEIQPNQNKRRDGRPSQPRGRQSAVVTSTRQPSSSERDAVVMRPAGRLCRGFFLSTTLGKKKQRRHSRLGPQTRSLELLQT